MRANADADGRREDAAEALVALMRRDRAWNEDGARKKLLEFFDAWGPKDKATLRGRRLLSGRGETTRPMMEKVRTAVFDMLLSHSPAGPGAVPPGAAWLDLYAGTGSVGLEALSRGADTASFIEMDSWVVSNVLRPNIKACGAIDRATVHACRAEDFIARHDGRAFDFVSICPPYVKVSYPDLLGAVAASPSLLHARSLVIVEYPRLAERDMPETLGPLGRVSDRRYGRTLLAIYGPVE